MRTLCRACSDIATTCSGSLKRLAITKTTPWVSALTTLETQLEKESESWEEFDEDNKPNKTVGQLLRAALGK
jgi:hypothetical protein